MNSIRYSIAAVVLCCAGAATAGAQSIADQVGRAPDGTVRMSYVARPGVCGDGGGMIRTGRSTMHRSGHNVSTSSGDDDDDVSNCPCDGGPVRVALRVRDHHVVTVRTYVGGQWKANGPVVDLGTVRPTAAVDYLLGLASRADGEAGRDAIFPATIADSVDVWPRLLTLARNENVAHETRRQAVFWVSQAAGEAATRGLDELAGDSSGDMDVREQAVFALSQRPKDEGVPALIRIAKTNKAPELRRKALFWLGQSEDPRALTLFEDLLTKE
ncbi:MAG: HEAT repeat domain-containing protein [Gemmatimonadota bacterium]